MSAVKVITQMEYLKEVFSELQAVKGRGLALRKISLRSQTARAITSWTMDRHLLELAEYLDWKLQVLEKGTSFDWKAAGTTVESDVSVRAPEKGAGPDIFRGYLGG